MTVAHFTGVIMDMDGVLWRGDMLLPGALAWFAFLKAKRIPFALATNNSSKTPLDYIGKLEKFGIEGVSPTQIVTSGTTTADYLRHHYPPGAPIHVLGGDGLRALVTDAGFVLSDQGVAVVVGLDPQLTYPKLRTAAMLVRAGADYIASNVDKTIPQPDGLAPGAGSIVAAVSAASDRTPIVMGKPNAPMFETALRLLATPPGETLMIGDRLDTDIAGAAALGIQTALVLSGVATREQVPQSAVQPDAIFEDLAALAAHVVK